MNNREYNIINTSKIAIVGGGVAGSFFQLLKEITGDEKSILLTTHDLESVSEFADKITVMSEGEVILKGAPIPI